MSISETAMTFFDDLETGKGRDVCKEWCHEDASFTVPAGNVYVMEFDGDKIRHMTKIWNDSHTLRQLGWA